MIRWLPLLAALLVVPGCARLPAIAPVTGDPAPGPGPCRVFPEGDWQFLHSIKAEMPGGGSFVSMGVTVMSSRQRTHRSVIMTFEGFVAFDGEYDGRLIVHRALPPFDSPHFAQGLMDDIRLVFFEPEGPLIAAGRMENGSSACRHETPDGGIVDIERRRDGSWELRRYSAGARLARTVDAQPPFGPIAGIPAAIELTAHDGQAYKLVMTLVEAVPVGE